MIVGFFASRTHSKMYVTRDTNSSDMPRFHCELAAEISAKGSLLRGVDFGFANNAKNCTRHSSATAPHASTEGRAHNALKYPTMSGSEVLPSVGKLMGSSNTIAVANATANANRGRIKS